MIYGLVIFNMCYNVIQIYAGNFKEDLDMSTSTAIRWKPEEKSWVQNCAAFEGVTFSEFVRNAVLEKIEDMADVQAYNEAIQEDDGIRYSMDDVKDMIYK